MRQGHSALYVSTPRLSEPGDLRQAAFEHDNGSSQTPLPEIWHICAAVS